MLKYAGKGLSIERQLSVLWENVRHLIGLKYLDGVEVTVADFTTGLLTISHGLGRLPRGWIVLRKVQCDVSYESGITSPATADTITLQVTVYTSDISLTLYVY